MNDSLRTLIGIASLIGIWYVLYLISSAFFKYIVFAGCDDEFEDRYGDGYEDGYNDGYKDGYDE